MDNLQFPSNGRPRERVLSPDELKAVYTVARQGGSNFRRILSLLVLCGLRRGEAAQLQWDFINEAERTITFPSSVSKNKRQFTVPYGEATQEVLFMCPRLEDHPYLFPAARQRSEHTTCFNGWGKAKAAFDVQLIRWQVEPWTLHDLRRTFSSNMAALGVPQIVVEKLLNQVSGGIQSPISAIYNRHAYMNEMREAVAKWETYLGNATRRS